MGNLFSTSRLTTVALTVVVVAALMRVEQVKEFVLNDKKFLGIF